MCVIFLAWSSHPVYRLVLLSNRDEDLPRPTAPLAEWEDAPGVVAGRDLERGGTWLGVNKAGRLAAITNVRVVTADIRDNMLTRGELPVQFLSGGVASVRVRPFAEELVARSHRYNDFNMLLGDVPRGELAAVHCDGARGACAVHEVAPGVHGLSNADFDTPWPKVVRGKRMLSEALEKMPGPASDADIERLFDILRDTQRAPDDQLPDTGCGADVERMLSPIHVRWPEKDYATRSMTLVLAGADGRWRVIELSLDPASGAWHRREEQFAAAPPVALGA
eukprot:tig00000076_g2442.t1